MKDKLKGLPKKNYALGFIPAIGALSIIFAPGIVKHCKLIKTERTTRIHIDKLPKIVEESQDVVRELDKRGFDQEISNCLDEFVSVLSDVPHFDLSNLYATFDPYCIEVHKIAQEIRGAIFSGEYDPETKIISLNPQSIRRSIFHELFHKATDIPCKDDRVSIYGFQRVDDINDYNIGEGLDEGYTQVLTERYFFDHGVGISDSYYSLKEFALFIENIVGQEKMEGLYSRGDLYNLILLLRPYENYENIILLLRKLDHIFNAEYKNSNFIPRKLAHKTYKEVSLMLARMLARKIKLERETLSDKQISFYVEDIINLLSNIYTESGHKLTLSRRERAFMENMINDDLKETDFYIKFKKII